jgi:hypothetical protein
VRCLLKAGIAKPEATAIPRKWFCEHFSMTTDTDITLRKRLMQHHEMNMFAPQDEAKPDTEIYDRLKPEDRPSD